MKSVLTHLRKIFDETGKTILLALEPEPGCLLETTEEFCRFYETMAFDEALKKHFGICYDCCHQAVEFEEPVNSLNRLLTAGIPIAKVQVSSGIQVENITAGVLEGFVESCYLHQTVVRRQTGELLRYIDLPDALACHDRCAGDEWRCHFHVPIFLSDESPLPSREGGQNTNVGTTQKFLTTILPLLPKDILLEVETYTWDVLPLELRCGTVTDSIISEIRWLKEALHA